MKKRLYIVYLFFGFISILQGVETKHLALIQGDTLAFSSVEELEFNLSGRLYKQACKGYPYSEFRLDKFSETGTVFMYEYRLQFGNYVYIDSLNYGDFSKRELKLLHFYSPVQVLGEFNLANIDRLLDGLNILGFLEAEKTYSIDNSQLNLRLIPNTKSKADGILSYKNDNQNSGFVGKFDLSLQNFFGLGRSASLAWYHPTLNSNFISLTYIEPFIFAYPFSLESCFRQDFRDSSYVKRDIAFTLNYHLSPKFEAGLFVSEEYIYTLNDALQTTDLSVSGLILDYKRRTKRTHFAINVSAALRQSKTETAYTFSHSSQFSYQKKKWGMRIKTLSGINYSNGNIPVYYQFALGGSDFLRGSYFEQYRSDSYAGLAMESGIMNSQSHVLLFYDTAWLHPDKRLLHQAGFQIKLPAGENALIITLGFDSKEPFSQGKIHVSWAM